MTDSPVWSDDLEECLVAIAKAIAAVQDALCAALVPVAQAIDEIAQVFLVIMRREKMRRALLRLGASGAVASWLASRCPKVLLPTVRGEDVAGLLFEWSIEEEAE